MPKAEATNDTHNLGELVGFFVHALDMHFEIEKVLYRDYLYNVSLERLKSLNAGFVGDAKRVAIQDFSEGKESISLLPGLICAGP